MSRRRIASIVGAWVLTAVPLSAQVSTHTTSGTASANGTHTHLRDRIRDLFSFGSCGQPLCLDNSVNATNGHGAHFLPDLAASNGAILGFLDAAIGANASNIPLSASSSGVTFKFVGGLPVRTSGSLGPVFGERAQTLGRGRFVVGANISGLRFSSLRGVPLDNIVLNFTHDDTPPTGLGAPLRENDVLQVRLDLDVNLSVTTFFATYGLTDRLDVSLAVPLVHTSLQGRSHGQFHPFGIPTSHFFAGDSLNPVLTATAATFGSATGIGDIAIRLKTSLRSTDRLGLALMADARLPTGSAENLTGAGHLSVRALAIASARMGDFSPHLNAGYAFRTGPGRNDVFLATGGFDQPMSPWATLAVDVISEWEVGSSDLVLPGTVNYQLPVPRSIEPTNIPEMRDHRISGSMGFKFRTPGGPILVTNALVPLRRGGLQSNLIWTVGLDANF
jgi:hypothetical protein